MGINSSTFVRLERCLGGRRCRCHARRYDRGSRICRGNAGGRDGRGVISRGVVASPPLGRELNASIGSSG